MFADAPFQNGFPSLKPDGRHAVTHRGQLALGSVRTVKALRFLCGVISFRYSK